MNIKLKKLYTDAKIPVRGSDSAAGYDLYARLTGDCFIGAHKTAKIGTGVSIEIPEGYFGAIFARSGLASKQSLRPANCVGVIDSDYRGEIIVALHNDSDEERIIHNEERIAQFVVIPYLALDFEVVDELTNTERGEGGFGSTGTIGEVTPNHKPKTVRRGQFKPFRSTDNSLGTNT